MADVKDNNYFIIAVNDAGEVINPEIAPIVEAHGGITWAENNPDGATFIFTLPTVSNNKN
jgi:signal transduction histidine kinase